uniref:Putative modular serine protease n=1 Tax=Corethrella appendiculata TaxID=1370023 RepID=U5EPN9_9DIPT
MLKLLEIQILIVILLVLEQQVNCFPRTKRKTCSNIYEWKCTNGQCIESHQLCDGAVNCMDRSDETAAACAFIRCPSYAFRCQYGACADGNALCNGIIECADKSDEHTIQCPGFSEAIYKTGNCSDDQFQCNSGKCISSKDVCDGAKNCDDVSDETAELCSLVFCPSFAFRCSYGACISGYSKCNGIIDCHDGSDEDEILCGKPFPSTTETATTTTVKPITTKVAVVTTTTAKPVAPEGACIIPNHPQNGRIVLDESMQNFTLKPGEFIENYNSVFVICNDKYVMKGVASIVCLDGTWLDEFPICERYCSELTINGITINPSCEYQRKQITCKKALPPGTKARIDCRVGYRKPLNISNDIFTCGVNGNWDFSAFYCEPICGIPTPDAEAYIIGGTVAKLAEVPWHAGIYRNLNNQTLLNLSSNDWKYVCGGTILTEKLILTAAHCFWNSTDFFAPDYFIVTVGKFHRELNFVEHLQPQISRVRELIYQSQYQDFSGLYNLDIMVVALNDFIIFKSHILPICLERDLRTESEKRIKPKSIGKVAGWGLTQSDGQLSSTLRVVELPTTDYFTCREKSPVSYRPFLTGDKFCAGYPDLGISVCQGDSGGGFALNKTINDETMYYLYGIVSSAPRSASGSCDNNKYVAFTEVQNYIPMILDAENRYPVI